MVASVCKSAAMVMAVNTGNATYFHIAESVPVPGDTSFVASQELAPVGNEGLIGLGYNASARAALRTQFGKYVERYNITISSAILAMDGPWPLPVKLSNLTNGRWTVAQDITAPNAAFMAYSRNSTMMPTKVYPWSESPSNGTAAIPVEEAGYLLFMSEWITLPSPIGIVPPGGIIVVAVMAGSNKEAAGGGSWGVTLQAYNFNYGGATTLTWQGINGTMTEGQSGTGVVGAANQEVEPGSWVFRMSAYFRPGDLPAAA
eukprot:jgi/Botrbrau1/4762/Bobra.0137s0034.1